MTVDTITFEVSAEDIAAGDHVDCDGSRWALDEDAVAFAGRFDRLGAGGCEPTTLSMDLLFQDGDE